jgi:hypothetical protein
VDQNPKYKIKNYWTPRRKASGHWIWQCLLAYDTKGIGNKRKNRQMGLYPRQLRNYESKETINRITEHLQNRRKEQQVMYLVRGKYGVGMGSCIGTSSWLAQLCLCTVWGTGQSRCTCVSHCPSHKNVHRLLCDELWLAKSCSRWQINGHLQVWGLFLEEGSVHWLVH